MKRLFLHCESLNSKAQNAKKEIEMDEVSATIELFRETGAKMLNET